MRLSWNIYHFWVFRKSWHMKKSLEKNICHPIFQIENFLVRHFSEIFHVPSAENTGRPNQPPQLSRWSRSRRANGNDLHGGHDLDDTSDTPGGVLGWKGGCGTGYLATHFTKRHNWVGWDFSGKSSPNMMEDSVFFFFWGVLEANSFGGSIGKIPKATKGQSLMKFFESSRCNIEQHSQLL